MAGCQGVTRGAGQGDHDRDEPPAGLHGDQPLRAPGRRRHPGPDPHGLRHRHDRRPRPTTPTTSRSASDEVQQMLDAGEMLVPGFRQARALHAWTGARPLFKDERARPRHPPHEPRARAASTTGARRRRRLPHHHRGQAHHLPPDGRRWWWTPCASSSASRAPCRTGVEVLPGSEERRATTRSAPACARARPTLADDQLVCECELLPRAGASRRRRRRPGDEPGRRAPDAAPGDGPLPGRLLHLPGHRASCTGWATPTPTAPTSCC